LCLRTCIKAPTSLWVWCVSAMRSFFVITSTKLKSWEKAGLLNYWAYLYINFFFSDLVLRCGVIKNSRFFLLGTKKWPYRWLLPYHRYALNPRGLRGFSAILDARLNYSFGCTDTKASAAATSSLSSILNNILTTHQQQGAWDFWDDTLWVAMSFTTGGRHSRQVRDRIRTKEIALALRAHLMSARRSRESIVPEPLGLVSYAE
jgi:hypothetical protein